jgi:CO/xanthine dehydrogenase Mo-binding subunit
MTSVIGKRLQREDAKLQVTGKLIYGDDLNRPNVLVAKALYSKYCHAEIISVDISKALKSPGVEAIITAKDVPNNRFGLSHKDQPVLADDKVRHLGDAIAVVAATNNQAAEEALKKIEVKYKVLPPVLDPKKALKDNTVLVHEESNLAAHVKIRHGNVEEAFKQADIIVEEEFTTQRVEHCHLETHVSLAEFDNDGTLIIWTSTGRPFQHASQIARILKLSMNDFKVKVPAVGGGFGGKNEVNIEPWVALLAKKTGKPVKMVWSREEEFFASTIRHPYYMRYKSGLDKSGKILAREIEIISDNGAYVGLGKATLTKAVIHAAGPYNIENVKIDGYLVYTNNIAGGAMRGFGVPQVCFAHECHTDTLAEKVGLDAAEFRKLNLFQKSGMMPTGQEINSKPLMATFTRALELSNWHQRRQ